MRLLSNRHGHGRGYFVIRLVGNHRLRQRIARQSVGHARRGAHEIGVVRDVGDNLRARLREHRAEGVVNRPARLDDVSARIALRLQVLGMEKFSGLPVSMNAFSSNIAWRSPINWSSDLVVLLRRQANWLVLGGNRADSCGGGGKHSVGVATAGARPRGAAALGSADGSSADSRKIARRTTRPRDTAGTP